MLVLVLVLVPVPCVSRVCGRVLCLLAVCCPDVCPDASRAFLLSPGVTLCVMSDARMLRVGMTVTLVSGGPVMTVLGVSGELVDVGWFPVTEDGYGDYETATLPASAVRVVCGDETTPG